MTRSTGWLTSPPRFWLGLRSAPCRAAWLAALAGAAVTGSYPSGTRESGSGDVTFAGLKIPTSFGLAMLPVQLLLVGACCVPQSYSGDGTFTDTCGSRKWSWLWHERYKLDFGPLDLTTSASYHFRVGGLPRAQMWLLGFDVAPRSDRPKTARLGGTVIAVKMLNRSGQPVIQESLPLGRWRWQLVVPAEEGVGPSFVYLSGKEREVPLGHDGSVRLERLGVLANGGWGTYFVPDPTSEFDLVVSVEQPDPNAQYFTARLQAVGSQGTELP